MDNCHFACASRDLAFGAAMSEVEDDAERAKQNPSPKADVRLPFFYTMKRILPVE